VTKVDDGLDKRRSFGGCLPGQQSKIYRKHGQLLIEAVMQFSSDALSLFFLGFYQLAG